MVVNCFIKPWDLSHVDKIYSARCRVVSSAQFASVIMAAFMIFYCGEITQGIH